MSLSQVIPPELAGVWAASKQALLEVNRKASERRWDGHFALSTIERVVDTAAVNLVVPILVNHPLDPANRSYRCVVSVKVAGRNERATTLLDLAAEDILALSRPTEGHLHRIVRGLIEAQPWVNLDSLE